jgi:winged helix-turn-helix protein
VPATCPFRGHARRFTVILGAAGRTPGLCIRRSSCRGHFYGSKRSSEDDVPRGRTPSFGPGRATVSADRQALRCLQCLRFLPGSEDLPGGVIKGVTVPVHHLPSAVSRRKAVATQAHSAAGPRAGWTLGRIKTLIGRLFHVGCTVQGTWKVMRRHGWPCQVPVRQAMARGEGAIAMQSEVWPQIKRPRATWAPGNPTV